jgi:alkanesulfonate monooxygenase SsuD/methylene tetrahydromethanopterin reductase-like flavin-dependent oxidoreductase (luciferase family)
MNELKSPSPLFGANIDPSASDPKEPFRRAQIADQNGLQLITVQDHPYNRRFFDTWTLLSALAMKTEQVHLGTNVISTPLRPPAMLSKMAATLDVICDGRLELGIGAGAYWPGIEAYGVEKRSPGEAVTAFSEFLHILRGMWENADGSFNYEGEFYQVKGARPGPPPAHPIRIWTGAYGDRMLDITGRYSDGIFVTSTYLQPEGLPRMNRLIDQGAEKAGRDPGEIRRGYNLMGVLDLDREDTQLEKQEPGMYYGPVNYWVDEILRLYQEYRQDTFIFWPIAGNEALQIEAFAKEVAPAAAKAIGAVKR